MAYLKRAVTVHVPFHKFGIEGLWWTILQRICFVTELGHELFFVITSLMRPRLLMF